MKRLQHRRETSVARDSRSRLCKNAQLARTGRQMVRGGFTLLEVMLVMAILIVLAGISASFLLNSQTDALDRAAMVKALELQNICKRFKIQTNEFPRSPDELMNRPARLSTVKWRRPFVEKVPNDPWNNPYKFEVRQEEPNVLHVLSAGANGVFGDTDDISTRDQ